MSRALLAQSPRQRAGPLSLDVRRHYVSSRHNRLAHCNLHAGYAKHLAASFNKTEKTLASIGVGSSSELGHLYLHYGPSAVKGWYELIEVDEISGCTEYATEAGRSRNIHRWRY